MLRSRRKQRLFAEGLIALGLVTVAGAALAKRVIPTASAPAHAIPAPANVSIDQLRPPPSPLQIVAAKMAATRSVEAAFVAAVASVPEVPWGQWGLAKAQIRPEAIRYDAGRDRYVAALDGGRTAILTWEPRIQRRLQDTVRRSSEPGEASVVLDPSTGRVLAMVSDGPEPTGNQLARRAYAWSASTFKVITAAALFDAGKATPQTQVCYHGGGDGFTVDLLADNATLDTLCVSFTRAMGLSANVVFGKLADRHLRPKDLQNIAERFGFNHRIPFEMEVETSGFIAPDARLDFAMAAAGFRHSRQSPLHGAMIQGAIANNGVMMVPTMVARIEDAHGATLWEHTPVEWNRAVSPQVARLLRDVQSTTATTGTARNDFGSRPGWPATITTWGKTGTLLNRNLDGTMAATPLMYQWFTGIAQRGEREVAVSSLVVQNIAWEIRGTYLASEATLAALPAEAPAAAQAPATAP